jgi:D-alanyl-D-alanine carboxypeptidase
MKTLSLSLALLAAVALTACGEKKDPMLEEAGRIHNEASEIQASIEPQVENIDSLQNLLAEKKKTLTDPAMIAKVDSVSAALGAITKSFEAWESNIIEVPGLEHKHAEGEHHHHDHKPAPNVTSEQLVELQKEMKTNIEKIKSDMSKAEEMLKEVL